MDSFSDSWATFADHRFFHMILWECRLLGWGRRLARRTAMFAPVAVIIMICTWRFAIDSEPLGDGALVLNNLAQLVMWASPLHSLRSTHTEMSFCYTLLRLGGYLTMLAAMLLIPGIAGAGISNDRRTGRLNDLVCTRLPSSAIYAAKSIAAALPFCVPLCGLYLIMVPVMISEGLSAGMLVRSIAEPLLQVSLIAMFAVTTSSVFQAAAPARVAAYIGVWIIIPAVWHFLLWCTTAFSLTANSHDNMYLVQADVTWLGLSNMRFVFIVFLSAVLAYSGITRLNPRFEAANVKPWADAHNGRSNVAEIAAAPIGGGSHQKTGGQSHA